MLFGIPQYALTFIIFFNFVLLPLFPIILDSFLLYIDCVRQAPIGVVGGGGGEGKVLFANEIGMRWDELGQVMGHSCIKTV